MSVRIEGDMIHLEGACPVEDAEPLMIALQEGGHRRVVLGRAGKLHMAVAQLLVAHRPRLDGVPTDPFLRDWLLPLLTRIDN
jgi:hypothetical protein